ALMTNPRLLILDEAAEGLAPRVRDEIWQSLERLRGGGQSILVIDKNIKALTRIVDRHYIIERGRIVWVGTSQQLAQAPSIQHRHRGVYLPAVPVRPRQTAVGDPSGCRGKPGQSLRRSIRAELGRALIPMASLADIRMRSEHAKPLNHQRVESRAQNERRFGA